MEISIQQNMNALKREVSIRGSRTIGELVRAVGGTYYDIFMEDQDVAVAYSYFSSEGGGKIYAETFSKDPSGGDSWVAIGEVEIDPNRRIRVSCYPEDTVCCYCV